MSAIWTTLQSMGNQGRHLNDSRKIQSTFLPCSHPPIISLIVIFYFILRVQLYLLLYVRTCKFKWNINQRESACDGHRTSSFGIEKSLSCGSISSSHLSIFWQRLTMSDCHNTENSCTYFTVYSSSPRKNCFWYLSNYCICFPKRLRISKKVRN